MSIGLVYVQTCWNSQAIQRFLRNPGDFKCSVDNVPTMAQHYLNINPYRRVPPPLAPPPLVMHQSGGRRPPEILRVVFLGMTDFLGPPIVMHQSGGTRGEPAIRVDDSTGTLNK